MKAAPLSGSLLVRKGAAAPADLSLIPAARRHTARVQAMEPSLSPAGDPNASKTNGRRPKVEKTADDRSSRCVQATAGPTAKFTLRLDRERHLRLKLLAAHLHLSAQELLVEALDAYFDQRIPEAISNNCSCLAQLEEDRD